LLKGDLGLRKKGMSSFRKRGLSGHHFQIKKRKISLNGGRRYLSFIKQKLRNRKGMKRSNRKSKLRRRKKTQKKN
jgi:hypothetical protein